MAIRVLWLYVFSFFFFFQAEDGIRDKLVTGVQTCALPISAAARGLARRVDPWQARPELLVGRELVEETALQPSAVAQQPVVGERHVLGLRHPHGDRLEAPEVGRAAELAAARPDAGHELGRVARAD